MCLCRCKVKSRNVDLDLSEMNTRTHDFVFSNVRNSYCFNVAVAVGEDCPALAVETVYHSRASD